MLTPTNHRFFREVLFLMTWGFLVVTINGNVLQSQETVKRQTSLETRILELESLVRGLTKAIEHSDNSRRQQDQYEQVKPSEGKRVRRALNVTDHNLTGEISLSPLSSTDLSPGRIGSVGGCMTGLPGRDGRDGRDGPAGLPGRDGDTGLKGDSGIRGEKGDRGEPGTNTAQGGGTTYIRWGRISCPDSAELVYQGITGGSHYRNSGSGANFLCLPNDPEYLNVQKGEQTGRARIYSTEYEYAGLGMGLHNLEVPCAVCTVSQRGRMIMIPAKVTCPTNWTSEYRGYLMAERADYHRGEYVCIDESSEGRPGGSSRNEDGALLHRVEGRCSPGNLPCLPYINGNELTCVVCTI